jgi:uncharacterized tellurite resistance protein B-like protein
MLKVLKEIVRNLAAGPDEAAARHSLQLAATALLLEIARADHEVSPQELAAVVRAASAVFGITEAESNLLVDGAAAAVERAVSFQEFTEVLNREMSRDQKRECLRALWRVAQADGRIDHFEEYYLRKLADLLHLSHRDFIAAKLEVTEPR